MRRPRHTYRDRVGLGLGMRLALRLGFGLGFGLGFEFAEQHDRRDRKGNRERREHPARVGHSQDSVNCGLTRATLGPFLRRFLRVRFIPSRHGRPLVEEAVSTPLYLTMAFDARVGGHQARRMRRKQTAPSGAPCPGAASEAPPTLGWRSRQWAAAQRAAAVRQRPGQQWCA